MVRVPEELDTEIGGAASEATLAEEVERNGRELLPGSTETGVIKRSLVEKHDLATMEVVVGSVVTVASGVTASVGRIVKRGHLRRHHQVSQVPELQTIWKHGLIAPLQIAPTNAMMEMPQGREKRYPRGPHRAQIRVLEKAGRVVISQQVNRQKNNLGPQKQKRCNVHRRQLHQRLQLLQPLQHQHRPERDL
jgi:hypothetical protein